MKIILTLVNLSQINEIIMKYFLTAFLILFLTINSFPQTSKYFDAPFGGGGGFVTGWNFPSVNSLNLKLKEIGLPELSKNGMFSTGGAGFIYIGFVKNLRIGGMGFGGSTTSKTYSNGDNLQADLSIGGGGLTVEYTLPFVKNMGVSVGAILGAGSMSLELYRNNGNFNWNDLWLDMNNGQHTSTFIKMQKKFWIFSPTINVDIPVYRFVALRLGTGYQFTFGSDWKADNDQTINGVPSDIKSDGFFIQAGIFAGFFSF